MLKQFVVNPNPKYIDKTADGYILLNELMLRDENRSIIGNNYFLLTAKKMTRKEYLETKEYIRSLSDRVIEYYTEISNKKFKLNLSSRQYKYFIGIWLEDFLFDAFDRYNKLLAVNEDVYIVCDDNSSVMENQQMYGFINTYDPDFQMQMYSKLFNTFDSGKVIVKSKSLLDKFHDKFSSKILKWITRFKIVINNPKAAKNKMIKNETENICNGISKSLVVESRMPQLMEKQIKEECCGDVEFVKADYFYSRQKEIDRKTVVNMKDRKSSFAEFEYENEFERRIDMLLINFLPTVYYEELPEIYNLAHDMVENWVYKKIYHSAHLTELFAMCCALMKTKGTEIIDIQHTAAYIDLICFGFKEFDVWDRFLTWGWEYTGNFYNNIYPVAMSRLPGDSCENNTQRNKLLLVTNIPELCDIGEGCDYSRYVTHQKEFISRLSDVMRRQLVIRVRSTEKKLSGGLVAWCKMYYPEVTFEDMKSISFTQSLLESKLLICDYFGSSHLEALFLNREFVMFDGTSVIVHNPSIVNWLKKMEAVGIYKKEAIDMADQISLGDEFLKKLKSKEVKEIFNGYLNEMTNQRKGIMKRWCEEFKR